LELISKFEFSIFLELKPFRWGVASKATHMSEDATQYRERAEEARQVAEKFKNPLDKEVWLHVAGEWLKLAQNAEMQARE
jgi:hypothetical protein